MGERKVLNKYYPPDFNPSSIPRRKQPRNHQVTVRMMLPMTIRCVNCGNYIYKGSKFNSRKEEVIGETYLGIKVLRFYFKCTHCHAEITYKTDHKNSDYTVELGATRNFEPWRNQEEAEEISGDVMKLLENKTLDSKRRMNVDDGIDELISMQSRRETVGIDTVLESLQQRNAKNREIEELEDEVHIKSVFANSREVVKRIHDDEEFEDDYDDIVENNHVKKRKVYNEKPTNSLTKASSSDQRKLNFNSSIKLSIVKKKPPSDSKTDVSSKGTLELLCQEYESDEDD